MRRSGLGIFVAAGCLLAYAQTSLKSAAAEERAAPDSSRSNQKLLQLMEQVQPPQPNARSTAQTRSLPAGVSPERLRERTRLLASGEAALARLDTAAAIDAFDQAALILHAADTEIALVRCYMQNGEYRRALAFGAHTAGAHLDAVGGSLLYAWLLHLGGQPAIAQRLLAQTTARMPNDALLQKVNAQITGGMPYADGPLLTLPTRLAPYGSMRGLPPASRVSGSGLLLPGGGQVLAPVASLPRTGRFWVRTAAGRLERAKVQKRFENAGVALLTLARPHAIGSDFLMPGGDAFPGSIAFAVEHVAASGGHPAWPVLRSGFLGGMPEGGANDKRLLGIDMPKGPRGGPVFNAGGGLVGLALSGSGKSADTLVPASALQRLMPELFKVVAGHPAALQDSRSAGKALHASIDQIYESSLKICVQIITAP